MFTLFLTAIVSLGQPQTAEGGQPSSQRRVPVSGLYRSVQVNVDSSGANTLRDAANGPSIGVNPTYRRNLVAAWRQFDSVDSNFVQVAWAYSTDAGASWRAGGQVMVLGKRLACTGFHPDFDPALIPSQSG